MHKFEPLRIFAIVMSAVAVVSNVHYVIEPFYWFGFALGLIIVYGWIKKHNNGLTLLIATILLIVLGYSYDFKSLGVDVITTGVCLGCLVGFFADWLRSKTKKTKG